MKSFQLSEEKIALVIGAASADEIARNFNRHYDFLTIASWSSETPIGRSGISLADDEARACADRSAIFFGLDPSTIKVTPDDKVADWARQIALGVRDRLATFTFKPAARDANNEVCEHSADEIFQDASAAANLFYGRRRLLSLVAPHSLLGFELSILTPKLQGIESLDARRMTPEQLTETLEYGDVLIATPTLWRYITREGLAAPDNAMAVSFGEPMTPELATDMRKAGFGVMREIYGSTENGLIGWRDSPAEPFVLFDHWRNDDGALVRIKPDQSDRNTVAMDLLEWAGPRNFQLGGRRDGAVQVGAVNVSPDHVAASLKEHPKVADCEIRVGRRGDGVNRLIAHIVLTSDAQPTERIAREIDVWCRLNLRQQERPRIYNFEAALTS